MFLFQCLFKDTLSATNIEREIRCEDVK